MWHQAHGSLASDEGIGQFEASIGRNPRVTRTSFQSSNATRKLLFDRQASELGSQEGVRTGGLKPVSDNLHMQSVRFPQKGTPGISIEGIHESILSYGLESS